MSSSDHKYETFEFREMAPTTERLPPPPPFPGHVPRFSRCTACHQMICHVPVEEEDKHLIVDIRNRLRTVIKAVKAAKSPNDALLVFVKKFAALKVSVDKCPTKKEGWRQVLGILATLTEAFYVAKLHIRWEVSCCRRNESFDGHVEYLVNFSIDLSWWTRCPDAIFCRKCNNSTEADERGGGLWTHDAKIILVGEPRMFMEQEGIWPVVKGAQTNVINMDCRLPVLFEVLPYSPAGIETGY